MGGRRGNGDMVSLPSMMACGKVVYVSLIVGLALVVGSGDIQQGGSFGLYSFLFFTAGSSAPFGMHLKVFLIFGECRMRQEHSTVSGTRTHTS